MKVGGNPSFRIAVSAALKLPIYKISTVAPGRLPEREVELSADGYGAKYYKNCAFIEDSEGYSKWFASHIYTRHPTAPYSPVEIHPRALTVHLPSQMTPKMFDDAFDREICKAAIDMFVTSAEGASHCQALGIDPARAFRYTAYPLGATADYRPCTELAIFRIREDSDRLVSIAELVVLRHLRLVA